MQNNFSCVIRVEFTSPSFRFTETSTRGMLLNPPFYCNYSIIHAAEQKCISFRNYISGRSLKEAACQEGVLKFTGRVSYPIRSDYNIIFLLYDNEGSKFCPTVMSFLMPNHLR